ncbi:CheB methylesterase domain-containing protein [Rhodobacter ferrooxidans]|uniref:protein-glutamate methylesterase n=1 Tax=Rhodobacter ferrooxidans TaxID=371731 RepID=C8S4D7_9RHOB|nr:CheB methylesterase domain-containing protein [Rhodobacter sp. SW2]EEW24196.1 CheB methylesterase [Rhodobacter sp. SW2]
MRKITVVIASTSPVNRVRISKLISTVPGAEIIAMTGDLSETFTISEAREPDLVVISSEFQKLDEFKAMKSLFYALDSRWIRVETDEKKLPLAIVHMKSGQQAPEPVIDFQMSTQVVQNQIHRAMLILRTYGNQPAPTPRKVEQTAFDRLVVIGSSTGGVDALLTLLSEFPLDCPPTAIVQHTGRNFSESLIRLLDRRCKPQVVGAQDGLILRPGMVCVAGGIEGHMLINGTQSYRCQIRPGPPVSGHVPSVDALFRSVLPLAPKVVGVILTGMGQDGAAGLLELRRASCITFGQDEGSSVVYGMPKTAWEMGAVQYRLPIQKIGAEVLRVCAQGSASLSQMAGDEKSLTVR